MNGNDDITSLDTRQGSGAIQEQAIGLTDKLRVPRLLDAQVKLKNNHKLRPAWMKVARHLRLSSGLTHHWAAGTARLVGRRVMSRQPRDPVAV